MTKNNTTKTYFIKGMHCQSCEILIEKEILNIDGVKKADVSLRRNCVEIYLDNDQIPKITKLNTLFEKLGYTFFEEKPKDAKLTKNDIKKIFLIFLLFVTAFYSLEKSGALMRFAVTPSSSLSSYFIFGLLAGLSSCAALVGGILLSLSGQWNKLYNGNSRQSSKPFIYFNLSRILAFAVLGGFLGLVGSMLQLSITTSSFLTLAITLLMLIIGFQMLGISWFKNFSIKTPKKLSIYLSNETNFTGKYVPMLVGAATFFVPCGFTLIAQTNALGSGSVVNGALMLTAFSLGTLPMLTLISFTSIKLYTNPTFSKKFSLFSGMLITFFALYTFNAQLNVLGLPSLNDIQNIFAKETATSTQMANITGNTQLIQLEAVGFEYYPKIINLKAGVKTRMEIYNSGATGCAQAVYAKKLYPDVIYLKQGLNAVEFTPTKPGVYKISCSMGMVSPVTVYVR